MTQEQWNLLLCAMPSIFIALYLLGRFFLWLADVIQSNIGYERRRGRGRRKEDQDR